MGLSAKFALLYCIFLAFSGPISGWTAWIKVGVSQFGAVI